MLLGILGNRIVMVKLGAKPHIHRGVAVQPSPLSRGDEILMMDRHRNLMFKFSSVRLKKYFG
jgi:hypothetical protein